MKRSKMKHSRRDFLSVVLAVSAAPALRETIAAPLPAPQAPLPYGAPGVKIFARPRDYSLDLPAYITRLMGEHRARRQGIMAGLNTREKVVERQRFIRAKLWELLGGPLETTPLNPRVVGSVARQGYRIDRLIYESRPRLFVTSNLYVPEGRGPFPAVLSSLGHAATGKTSYYQHLFHTLARKGYIVLAFDPFGQGERIEYPGGEPGVSAIGGATREHDYAGKRLLLLGVNFGLYRAWDGIRGIDYLLSRDDVDPARIGCGGQSGGATMTMFLAALDERIRAAVVSEGNTENFAQEGFEPPGSVDDAEQNIVPALPEGLDRFDLLHAFAPRPLLIAIGNKDAGTTYSPKFVNDSLAALEELKVTYRLLGAEESVKLVETPQRHGYVYELRRASYAWYNRWLGRPREDDREAPVTVEPDRNLWCTDTGFVVNSLGGETAFTLTRKLAAATKPAGPVTAEHLRRALALPKAAPNSPIPGWAAQTLSVTTKYDHLVEELNLVSEPGIQLPAWIAHLGDTGAGARRPAVLLLADAGKDGFVAEGQLAGEFVRAGFLFCAADVRGRGQCTPQPPSRGPRYYAGRGEDFYVWNTLVAGRPMLGGYVTDAQAALRALRARPDVDPSRLWIIGQGTMGVVALFTLALDPALSGAIVERALTDYRSIVENDRYSAPFRIYLFGVLKQFDLPDVAALAKPRPLLLLNPVDQSGRSVEVHAVASRYASATVRSGVSVSAATYLDWLSQK